MTGLEKILAEIRDEAAAEARQAVDAAKAEAEKLAAAAKEESDAKVAKIQAGAEAEVADIQRGRESALALQRRQRTLAQKQAILRETLDKALDGLYTLPDGQYFALLAKLAAGTAQPGEGQMLLNANDKGRMPADFEKTVAAGLPAGCSLSISSDTRPIDGGFVLKYGDVEENGSFRAVFDARADEFFDLIRDTLFA